MTEFERQGERGRAGKQQCASPRSDGRHRSSGSNRGGCIHQRRGPSIR